MAQGVTSTLEAIAKDYHVLAQMSITPWMPDHGVPEHNVFAHVSGEDFAAFHAQVCDAAVIARRALDSCEVSESANSWRELFGNRFRAARK